MNALFTLDGALVERVGWVLLNSLWQVFVIALFYRLSLLVCKTSHVRYWFGIVCLGLVALAPVITFAVLPVSQRVVTATESAVPASNALPAMPIDEGHLGSIAPDVLPSKESLDQSPPPSSFVFDGIDIPSSEALVTNDAVVTQPGSAMSWPVFVEQIELWMPLLVIGWLVGVVLLSFRPVLGWHYSIKVRHQGLNPIDEAVNKIFHKLTSQLGIKKTVQIFQSTIVQVPMVVGYLKPVVLIPASALIHLTPQELESILRHELAHIRRHDALFNFFQTVLETVLFFHPAMWWLSHCVRAERENCCDDLAANNQANAISLAQALLRLEESRQIAPSALAANGGDLKLRVFRLLGESTSLTKGNRTGIAAAIATIALALGVIGVLVTSQWIENINSIDQHKFTKVVVKSYNDLFEWTQFETEDAGQITKLVESFPEAFQNKQGMEPAGYKYDCQLVFSGEKDERASIGINFDLKLWSEGNGDWKISDSEKLKSLVSQLAEENLDFDAEKIYWGEPNKNGFVVGYKLTPAKKHYSVGETAKLYFYVRNESGVEVDFSHPRVVQPVWCQFMLFDQKGNNVDVDVRQEMPWIGGWFGMTLANEETASIGGPEIRFGGGLDKSESEWVVVADVQSGAKLDLQFDLSDYMDLLDGCRTGIGKAAVVTGFRGADPTTLVEFKTLEQLKDIDPQAQRLKFVGDRYDVDREWIQVIADRYDSLWELDLGECRSLQSKDIEPIASMSNLKLLRIRFAENLPSLAAKYLENLQNLEVLDISYTEKWCTDEAIKSISRLPNLHTLIMLRHSANGCSAESFARLSRMRSLKEVFVTQQTSIASSPKPKDVKFKLHVVTDRPSSDFYSRQYVTDSTPSHGLSMSVAMQREWVQNSGQFPNIDVDVAISDSHAFQASGLADKKLQHNATAFKLEINHKDYVHNVQYSTTAVPLLSPFRINIDMNEGFWLNDTGRQISGQTLFQYLDLQPGSYKLRVIFDGLGSEARLISDYLEFEILPGRQTWEGRFGEDDYGESKRRWKAAAKPVREKYSIGEIPQVDVRVYNRTEWPTGSTNRSPLGGHASPTSFDVLIDGEKYINDSFKADWQRLLQPGEWMDCRIDLNDEFRNGTDKLELKPGKYQVQVVYSEPQGNPDQAVSKEFEIEIVEPTTGSFHVPTDNEKSLEEQRALNQQTYNEEADRLAREHHGEWVAIVNGKVLGPFDSAKEAIEKCPGAKHRFIFRPGIDDGDVEFTMSPMNPNNPSWYQFGREFARTQSLTITPFDWRRDGKKIGSQDGRAGFSLLTPDGGNSVNRRAVCSGLFTDDLIICEQDVWELELDQFSVPGTAKTVGVEEFPGRKVLCQVQIDELGIEQTVVAYVILNDVVQYNTAKETPVTDPNTELSLELHETQVVTFSNPVAKVFVEDTQLARVIHRADNKISITALDHGTTQIEVENKDSSTFKIKLMAGESNLKEEEELEKQVQTLRDWSRIDWYRADSYMRVASQLNSFDEAKRTRLLEKWSKDYGHQVIILCRMLFKAKADGEFRRPMLGQPVFINAPREGDWPLEPIAIVDNVPFLVVQGYVLAGVAESANKYLEYCLQNCDWSNRDYTNFDQKSVTIAYRKLTQNPAVDRNARAILKQQSETAAIGELDYLVTQLGSWDSYSNGQKGVIFRSVDYMEMANELMKLPAGKRKAYLNRWAWLDDHEQRVIILCRMLFQAVSGDEFRRPFLGGPVFIDGSEGDWPLEPIAIVDQVPFVIVTGYDLGGRAEPASKYLEYCLANCEWTANDYAPKTEEELNAIAAELLESKEWTEERLKKFIEQQIAVRNAEDHKQWTLYGKVTDEKGNPLEGVEVRVSSGMATLLGRSLTNTKADGTYELHFGEGVWSQGANLQVAWVFVEEPGYVYKSNSRNIDLSMMMSRQALDEETLSYYRIKPKDLIVRNHRHHLDIVMAKPAEALVTIVDEKGERISESGLMFDDTNQTSEAGSIELSETEKSETDLAIGLNPSRPWRLSLPIWGRYRQQSSTLKFPVAGRYKILVRRIESDGFVTLKIDSITKNGRDVKDECIADETLSSQPFDSEKQKEVREFIKKMADANSYWLRFSNIDVDEFAKIRFHIKRNLIRSGKGEDEVWKDGLKPYHLIPDYQTGLHAIAEEPSRAVVRSLKYEGDLIKIGYSLKDPVRRTFGNGILGEWAGYTQSSATDGVLTIDSKTWTPVHHQSGEFNERFYDFVELDDGKFVPLKIEISGKWNFKWNFQVFEDNQWVIQSIDFGEIGWVRVVEAEQDGDPLIAIHGADFEKDESDEKEDLNSDQSRVDDKDDARRQLAANLDSSVAVAANVIDGSDAQDIELIGLNDTENSDAEALVAWVTIENKRDESITLTGMGDWVSPGWEAYNHRGEIVQLYGPIWTGPRQIQNSVTIESGEKSSGKSILYLGTRFPEVDDFPTRIRYSVTTNQGIAWSDWIDIPESVFGSLKMPDWGAEKEGMAARIRSSQSTLSLNDEIEIYAQQKCTADEPKLLFQKVILLVDGQVIPDSEWQLHSEEVLIQPGDDSNHLTTSLALSEFSVGSHELQVAFFNSSEFDAEKALLSNSISFEITKAD